MTEAEITIAVEALAPERFIVTGAKSAASPLPVGLVGELLFPTPVATTFVALTPSLWRTSGSWEAQVPFDLRITDLGLDLGVRSIGATEPESGLKWWGEMGAGLRGSLMELPHWEDGFAYGLGAYAATGLSVGNGAIRPVFTLRGEVSMRVDSWTGTVITGAGTESWTWYPGYARITAAVGFAVGGKRAEEKL